MRAFTIKIYIIRKVSPINNITYSHIASSLLHLLLVVKEEEEVGAEVVCDPAQANGSEEVDSEPSVFGIVLWEDEGILNAGVTYQTVVESLNAEVLGQSLEQDFDEDPRGGGGVVLRQADAGEDVPRQRIRGEQVGEQVSQVAEVVRLQTVDSGIVSDEAGPEIPLINTAQQAKPLGEKGVVGHVSPLLATALQQHNAHFHLNLHLLLLPCTLCLYYL